MTKVFPLSIYILCLASFLIAPIHAEEEGVVSKEPKPRVQYHALKPPFVANFGKAESKRLKFIKADVSLVVSDSEAISVIDAHNSLIRHQIVMSLSKQSEESLSTTEGQEALRLAVLKKVQAALSEETDKEQIDDLLFTNFVVQR